MGAHLSQKQKTRLPVFSHHLLCTGKRTPKGTILVAETKLCTLYCTSNGQRCHYKHAW